MLTFLQVWWKPLFLLWVVGIVGVVSYNAGQDDIQQKWDAERVTIATALKDNAIAQRAKEQALQDSMNQVQTNATQKLEALSTDADSANAAADRLREQVGKLLAADRLRQGAGTCASRTATENPGNLLAVLLDKSIQRNRELAAFADAAMNSATWCAAGYKKARD